MVEFGLDTFGDVTVDEHGQKLPYAQVIRNVVEQAVLAERVGVDGFGLGEHHRDDFAVSAPEIVLAAIAARTERIRLGTAVTVLSSDDPVRVFERFATLDAVSHGRAEIILGRGSFTESFPLFGFDLHDYERLFEEKADLMVKLLDEGPVSWEGTVRLPLVLAIIGGEPVRFAPYVELYQRALEEFEQPSQPVAAHCPGFVAETDEEAVETLWPHARTMLNRIGRERGWPPLSRDRFENDIRDGAWHVGSPETVARKVAHTIKHLGIQRFDLKYSAGTLPHDKMLTAIELYGTKVIPRVKELLAEA